MSVPVFPNYINGVWVEGPTFENRNPADTNDIAGLHGKGTPQCIDNAAHAAQQAFPGWAGLTAPARGAFLFKAADILDRKFESISADMTREEGKTRLS